MIILGLDEVGRGCLAERFVCCAAAFNINSLDDITVTPILGVRDSKKFISHKSRETVETRVLASELYLGHGIGEVSVKEINNYGMSWAFQKGFERALASCIIRSGMPDWVLIDGTVPIASCKFKQKVLPKADSLWWPVSAASVLAKTFRDRILLELSKTHPNYGFDSNFGYGSSKHIDAILEYGRLEDIHRTQFVDTALATRARKCS